jgi:NADH dehydrogenase FAD-containing subunit
VKLIVPLLVLWNAAKLQLSRRKILVSIGIIVAALASKLQSSAAGRSTLKKSELEQAMDAQSSANRFDVVIVGGGPAGLSAALVLGRSRKRVLVCDSGKPRNAVSHAAHGFFSRDGISPLELLHIAREQLQPYDTVQLQMGDVIDAQPIGNGFQITLSDGKQCLSRKLLLATGVKDIMPEIPGFTELWGRSVFPQGVTAKLKALLEAEKELGKSTKIE